MTLSGAIFSGQSEPGSDGNEVVLRIPQSSSITGTSPSDCLVSYQDIYPSTEMQSGYSAAQTDWDWANILPFFYEVILKQLQVPRY